MDFQASNGKSIYQLRRCLLSFQSQHWVQEKDWLALVAVHSDAWLLCDAFYFGARFGFDKSDRKRLFNMINDLPTIYEVVTGAAKKQVKERSSVSNHSITKSKSNSKVGKYSKVEVKDEDDGLDEEEEEHGDTLWACGENYASDEFWICCDICERWFHGKCVKITPAKADTAMLRRSAGHVHSKFSSYSLFFWIIYWLKLRRCPSV